jgi:hypothetical protein
MICKNLSSCAEIPQFKSRVIPNFLQNIIRRLSVVFLLIAPRIMSRIFDRVEIVSIVCCVISAQNLGRYAVRTGCCRASRFGKSTESMLQIAIWCTPNGVGQYQSSVTTEDTCMTNRRTCALIEGLSELVGQSHLKGQK